ncbi:hypothetical protein F4861DRAFT_500577 [Xylaria intraflava]|nr:hypothetical protein F4861DRAFT_500577 [Xylaria intraflava]
MPDRSTQTMPIICKKENAEKAVEYWVKTGHGFPNPARPTRCSCGEYGIGYEIAPEDCPHFATEVTWRCGKNGFFNIGMKRPRLCRGANKNAKHRVPKTAIVVGGECIFCTSKSINDWKKEQKKLEKNMGEVARRERKRRLAHEQLALLDESKANQDALRTKGSF